MPSPGRRRLAPQPAPTPPHQDPEEAIPLAASRQLPTAPGRETNGEARIGRLFGALAGLVGLALVAYVLHSWQSRPALLHAADLALVLGYLWMLRHLAALRADRGLAPGHSFLELHTVFLFGGISGLNLFLALIERVGLGPGPVLPEPISLLGELFLGASAFGKWNMIRQGSPRRPLVARLQPAHTVALAFGLTIAAGALLLLLPQAVPAGQGLAPVDALFTATSATCVTGLIVKDTPVDFTPLGHAVILLLMQLGGLGIMTFSALSALLLRRRSSMQHRLIVRQAMSPESSVDFRQIVVAIVKFVLVAEGVGTLVLLGIWLVQGEHGARAAALAVFHSVSAFCNAGFSLYSDSFVRYTGNVPLNLVICGLILVGGAGFPVVRDLVLGLRARRRGRQPSLSLQTRMVVAASLWLLLIGFVGTVVFESDGVLGGLSGRDRTLAAFFQAVTPRTAGFNTLDISRLAGNTAFLYVLLMFIGASPGSTGGGIKTTTAATLYLTAKAILLGQRRVHVAGRAIPESARHRAMAVAALSAAFVVTWALVLSLTEDRGVPFPDLLFETVSAFGTVGLSRGVTQRLSGAGRVLIALAMFVGRVGPLTVAAAIRPRRERAVAAYPEEDIMVG